MHATLSKKIALVLFAVIRLLGGGATSGTHETAPAACEKLEEIPRLDTAELATLQALRSDLPQVTHRCIDLSEGAFDFVDDLAGKPRRRRPTKFKPIMALRSVARVYGATSREMRAPPPIMALSPMRQNW